MATIATAGPGMRSYKFTVLLLTLFLFLAVNPFFAGKGTLTAIAFNAFVLLVVVATVYAVGHRTSSLLIAAVFAATTLVTFLVADLTNTLAAEVFGFLFLLLLWAYSAGSILLHILSRDVVTLDELAGSICVYLQIGLVWAVLFYFIDTFVPGSFNFTAASLTGPESSRPDFFLFTYYSFVTLATVGYGDLLALSPPARAFSFLEAAVAQIYLAVLVARLLGLHLARIQNPRSDGEN